MRSAVNLHLVHLMAGSTRSKLTGGIKCNSCRVTAPPTPDHSLVGSDNDVNLLLEFVHEPAPTS